MEDWVFGKSWYGEQAAIANRSDTFMNEKSIEEESLVIPVTKYSLSWI
jgi:hypothetical protein